MSISNSSCRNTTPQPPRAKLIRSKSCIQDSKTYNRFPQKNFNTNIPDIPALGMNSVRSQEHDAKSILNIPNLPSYTVEERYSRVQSILNEIKKEQPFSHRPLYTLPISYQYFVWSPFLDTLYRNSSHSFTLKSGQSMSTPVVPKPSVQRSQSATSLRSSERIALSSKSNSSLANSVSQNISRKDVVKMNTLSTARMAIKLKNQVKTAKSGNLATNRTLKLGAVPKYLQDRKAVWASEEERRLKSLPDPDCPPGHILMPETERLETLDHLKKSHSEMIEEYNSLPVSKDTLRIRQKREDIEKQLAKLEDGIRILSKSKVFVKVDH